MAATHFSRIVLLGDTGYIGNRVAAAFKAAAPDLTVVGRSAPSLDLTAPDAAVALQAQDRENNPMQSRSYKTAHNPPTVLTAGGSRSESMWLTWPGTVQ